MTFREALREAYLRAGRTPAMTEDCLAYADLMCPEAKGVVDKDMVFKEGATEEALLNALVAKIISQSEQKN